LVPTPVPPLGAVEVVLELAGVVADELDAVVLVVLLAGVVVVLVDVLEDVLVVGVVLVVEVVLVFVVGVVEVVVELELWQSTAASWLTVEAPWARFWASVVLTVVGRLATEFANERAAASAPPHCPEATAEESVFSLLFRSAAWFADSSPLPPPQATTNDTAKPSPPARNARDP
jgi:cytochrome c biogenesis protein CcdA